MKAKYFTYILIALVISCTENDNNGWSKVVKTDDYKKLENYILSNPNSSHFNEAIFHIKKLKNKEDSINKIPLYPAYYGRNIARIVLRNDSIFWIGEKLDKPITKSNLYHIALEYLINKSDDSEGPEKEIYKVDNTPIIISHGRFLIVYDKNSNPKNLQQIIYTIKKVLIEYRKSFLKDLELKENSLLDTILFNNRVSIFDWQKNYE
ncbi:hypothetical protein [Saccharicrinis sp. FJH54]|uniref:hypothetical protein n=1 Tax=Saccharicrinis sp. FJH54 TaxID=3344665 RepID=UPI0035D41BE7